MNIRRSLIKSYTRGVKKAVEVAECTTRDRRNEDIVLSWALQKVTKDKTIHFPVHYVDLLRDCIEKKTLRIREIKTNSATSDDTSTKRFSSLVDAIRNVPPIEFSIAEEIALIADSYLINLKPIERKKWEADVRYDFEISSSFGKKGRVLTTVVRLTRSKRCLELGTAYGMSALFTLEALRSGGTEFHLTTLEAGKKQFSLSSRMLKTRYGNQVSCEFGLTQEALPRIVKSLKRLDFLFHDAGHSKEDYVRDFNTVLPILAPGAVVLIDDINWSEDRSCYEGWMDIVNHPRICRAIELYNSMGLLLLGR